MPSQKICIKSIKNVGIEIIADFANTFGFDDFKSIAIFTIRTMNFTF